ncbi:MAG: type II toxin-antitoxin system VapC family toxin [Bryobacteraceae bacterium]|jgi:predicted nucleic acid-binding protein
MYLDSAYIAKYYVNEPDAPAVRMLIRRAPYVCSCSLALPEVTCVFQRHAREGALTQAQGRELIDLFRGHVEKGVWNLIPMTEGLLRRAIMLIRGLPQGVPLRACGAIHMAAALEAGEPEIWTNDRHLLAASAHCGIAGRSV